MTKSKTILAGTIITGALAVNSNSSSGQGTSFIEDTSSEAIRPFNVHIPQAQLDDLRRRILATNWPDREIVTDQSQGVQLSTIQALAHYWANRLRLA